MINGFKCSLSGLNLGVPEIVIAILLVIVGLLAGIISSRKNLKEFLTGFFLRLHGFLLLFCALFVAIGIRTNPDIISKENLGFNLGFFVVIGGLFLILFSLSMVGGFYFCRAIDKVMDKRNFQ